MTIACSVHDVRLCIHPSVENKRIPEPNQAVPERYSLRMTYHNMTETCRFESNTFSCSDDHMYVELKALTFTDIYVEIIVVSITHTGFCTDSRLQSW